MSLIVCDITYRPGKRGNQREERLAVAQGMLRQAQTAIVQCAALPKSDVEMRLLPIQGGGESARDIEVHVRSSVDGTAWCAMRLQEIHIENFTRMLWDVLRQLEGSYPNAAISSLVVAVWNIAPSKPAGVMVDSSGEIHKAWGCSLSSGDRFHTIDPVV